MKIGEPTSFITSWKVGVSDVDLMDKIFLTNATTGLNDSFNTEANVNATTNFKKIYINKAEMQSVLGELGTITLTSTVNSEEKNVVFDPNDPEIPTITLADGKEYYTVAYQENVEKISITTSKPQKEGIITILNEKELVSNDDVKAKLANISTLTTSAALGFVQGEDGMISSQNSCVISLLNTTNSATIEADKTTISTMQKTAVNFTVTLNENDIKYDLYKNPTITVTLPNYITSIENVTAEITQANGLTIKDKKVEGNKIIITLEGETTAYITSNPQIVIGATLATNKLIPTTEGKAELTVTNQNNQTPAKDAISLTAEAGQGILTATTVDSVTAFKENQTAPTLQTASEEKISKTITGTIINNTANDLSNVVVIGKTSGENSTIAATLKTVTGGTVKYTASSTVDANSEWVSQMPANATGYKITFDSIAKAETKTFTYTIELPTNLEINKSMDITYKVINGTASIDAPTVTLQTPQETKLELKVTPTAENNTVVYEGQKLTYNVTVKNTGNNTAKNIKITNTVPEGTTLVSGSSLAWTIDSLEAGKEITKTMEVTVNNLAEGEETKQITVTTTVEQEYLEETLTNTIKNTVKKTSIIFTEESIYGELFYAGDKIDNIVTIKNVTDKTINNVIIERTIPEGTTYYKSTYSGDIDINDITFDDNTKVAKWKIDSIKPGESSNINLGLIAKELINNENEKDLLFGIVIKSESTEILNAKFIDGKIIKPNIEVTGSKSVDKAKVGDEITYEFNVTNNSDYATSFNSTVSIGAGLLPKSAVCTIDSVSKEMKIEQGQTMSLLESLKAHSNLKLVIVAEVTNQYEIGDTIESSMNLKINGSNNDGLSTVDRVVFEKNILLSTTVIEDIKPTDPSDPTNPTDPETPQDPSSTYTLSGKAWLDENKDGKIDSEEQLLKDISVKIKDATTGEFLKDKDNNLITVKTDDKGEYQFKDIKPGKYILVFECDTKTYGVTVLNGDSAAVATTEDGQTVIKTDTIQVKNSNIENINLGLIKNPKFDLQLDKYVSKITVQNADGTTTYNYDKSQLAKVEISSKKMANSVVLVEYTIDVTNKGEVDGYAKSLVDYVSKEYNFSSELNTSWYQGTDNNLYCLELAEEAIKSGETKSVKLVLSKTMTTTNTGLISNTAEIAEDFNDFALSDINSTPGNNEQKENDMSGADVLISVKTGGVMLYIGIILASMLILGGGIYIVNKKVIVKKEI